MVEWNHKENQVIFWRLALFALIISVLSWINVTVSIMTNQTALNILLINAVITTLSTLALVGIAIWRTKRQKRTTGTKGQVVTESLKGEHPSLLIVGLGVLFIAVGLWIVVILRFGNPFALFFVLILFALGIVTFVYGIVKLGKGGIKNSYGVKKSERTTKAKKNRKV